MTEPAMPPAGGQSDEDGDVTTSAPGTVDEAGHDGSMPFESAGGPEGQSNAQPGDRGAP